MSTRHPPPLPGTKFANFEVISFGKNPTGKQRALVRCFCGKEKEFALHQLYRGRVKSCGCVHRVYDEERRDKVAQQSRKLWAENREKMLEGQREYREFFEIWRTPKRHIVYYNKLRAIGMSYDEAKAEVKKLMEKESLSAEEILQRPLRLRREQAGPSPSGE